MFDYLAAQTSHHRRAWDCATGNGQAALGLAERFDRVYASDASVRQIANAQRVDEVYYLAALAEQAPFPDRSMDLILVAQALHWLDLERFYGETRRTLGTGGLICVCSYNLLRIDESVDPLLDELYREVLGAYWPPQRRMVEDGYRSLPFPFRELEPPRFQLEQHWPFPQLIGYLGTWSAVERFRQRQGTDPIASVSARLREAWGPPEQFKPVRWPLTLRVGRT